MPLWNIIRAWSLVTSLPYTAAQSRAEWDALNATVNGRLRVNTPLALPCFSFYNGSPTGANEESCAAIRENYTRGDFLADHASGYYYSQGGICLSDPLDECVLDPSPHPAGAPAPGASCNQGGVPSRYIEVRESSDITAAFEFSRITGVPLAVKNSGHDFMTRSSQKGALMLWVYTLKGMTHHDDFVPQGCEPESGTGRAMTIATGVSTQEALVFASAHNSTVIVGYSPDLAISGGWVLGGGHSVLSPVYGLGVDRVVEFKVVTSDGILRVANRCQHPDLFWALKGGGGGTFGVVLEATHRVEPAMPIAVAHITLPTEATVDTSLQWIELMARESLRWGEEGWGGHVAGLWMTHMNPLPRMTNLGDGGAAAQKSVQAATDFALSVGGTSVVEVLPDFLSVWNKYIATNTGGSLARVLSSRLIPRTLFSDEEGIQRIMGYIRAVQELGFDPRALYVPVDTPFVARHSVSRRTNETAGTETSVHPAWYKSLWSLSAGVTIPWNVTYPARLQNMTTLTKATLLSEQLTGTEGAAYPNEANPFAQKWRMSWWGENFERLLEAKRRYDPDSLLKCWKCVGFEDADIGSDRYRCQGKLQQDIDEALS
ncbi:putative isoamyl alcohol [Rosellinia necatrix]|uniref:Putative isoamyl alcohol n=1 Tax=Rosellinia necatrix TaxID=77044 RepID=A0A1S7UI30_ROSNE|nr:putative isoamyl alcohol [Rosellinia necatrix]